MASGTPTAPPAAPPPKTPPPGDEGPSRVDVLLRNRKRLLIALALLALAAAIAIGSAAVFTSSSVNPTNTFSSGTLKINNSKDNSAILTASKMVPGDSKTGTVTIKNDGDSKGVFSLSQSGLKDTAGPNDPNAKLSDVLQLTVTDVGADGNAGTADDKVVYGPNGPFKSMPKITLDPTWNGQESRTYEFKVTFPNGGLPSGAATGDNAYQGASTEITYNWDAVST